MITQPDEISKKLQKLTYPTIIKSQIAIGSRKKAGLIQIAKTQREAIPICQQFLNTVVAGFKVEALLLEPVAQIEHEYYCSIALDYSGKIFYLIVSTEGRN